MGYVIYEQLNNGKRRYVDQDDCQRNNIADGKKWVNVPDMIRKAYRLRERWDTPYVFWEKVSAPLTNN